MCPGIPFAERTLWIEIAMLLWTFNIRRVEQPSSETGLSFHYDDSDAGFSGDVRVYRFVHASTKDHNHTYLSSDDERAVQVPGGV